MRSPDDHLNAEEIDSLVAEYGTARTPKAGQVHDSQDLEEHVRRCELCERAVEQHARVQALLESLGQPDSFETTSGCPQPEEWVRLAEKSLDEPDTTHLLEHAGLCARCGIVLSVLEENMSMPGEMNAEPFPRGGDRELAREMARRSAPPRTRAAFSPWLWGAAAAALAISMVGLFLWRASSEDDIAELVRLAYAKDRTLELRFEGAPHAPLRIVRGPVVESDESIEYLEAQARVLKGLRERPDDLELLHAHAKLNLLSWDFDRALATLERMVEENPETPEVCIDLATAYYERAQSAERTVDYGRALELLDRVLEDNPGNQVALFNRAVLLEKLQLFRQASAAWDDYLRRDTSGEWADEARARRDAIHARVNEMGLLQGTPNGLYRTDGDLPEELLQRAITDWLPKTWGANAFESEAAGDRLVDFAGRLLERHEDSWLRDLLEDASESWFPDAARSLVVAVSANSGADSDRAYASAIRAANIFRRHGNRAGAARATYEAAYSLQRNSSGERCLSLLPLVEANGTGRYSWVEIQRTLEEASCSNMTGDLSRARRTAERALAQAVRSRYPLLRLRATGILATQYTALSDIQQSWDLDQDGLRVYWGGSYPPVRAYQFYDDLSMGAETMGLVRAARDTALEAAEQAALTGNSLWEAAARAKTARILLSLGDVDRAAAQFDLATGLFALASSSESRRVNQIYAEIGLALVEAKQGNPRSALARLEAMREKVARTSNQIVEEAFYLAKLETSEALNDGSEMARALEESVRVATQRLESIETPASRRRLAPEISTVFRRLVSVYLERDEDRAAFDLWERYKTQPMGSTSWIASNKRDDEATALPSFNDAPSLAKEEESRLVYLVLPDRVQIWSYHLNRYFSVSVPISKSRLASLVRVYVRLCSDPRSDMRDILTAGERLYRLLGKPVASTLDSSTRLIVQPDGVLADVPFDALFALHGDHPFVGGIALSLGGPANESPPRVSASDENFLSVNAPALSKETSSRFRGLVPLSDARREGELSASRFFDSTLLSGAEATAARFESALQGASVVHFAGHAVVSAERSYLLLAGQFPDALWTPSLLPPQSLEHCRLVVLSACSTDRPTEATLDAPGPLVTGFLDAGARQVIATRWSVDSAATADVVTRLLSGIADGNDAGSALSSAISATRARRRHPYFWAGFALYLNTTG